MAVISGDDNSDDPDPNWQESLAALGISLVVAAVFFWVSC